MLKLLLNIVTFGIEALVILSNKFLYACVKQSAAFELSHVLTPSINSSVLQVGKQVVVTQSKIGAVRRVVKQPPVEILQQCSSASICMRMHIVMGSTTPYVSIPCLLF
jgi:hypothetical protein